MIVYDLLHDPVTEIELDKDDLTRDLHRAIYRFWLNERRMPSAVIMPTQLAWQFSDDGFVQDLVGDLRWYGNVQVSEIDSIPILGRPSHIDPLFMLI
jgi:hypothetical protein